MRQNRPISNCHPPKISIGRGLCRNCYSKFLIAKNPDYHEKQKRNAREWRLKNPEKVKLSDQRKRLREKNNPEYKEKKFYSSIKKKYKVTKEQYLELLNKTGNKCFLCNKSPKNGKRLHLDHCHKTLVVRGLLCAECNWYMSKFDNIPGFIEKVRSYLNTCKENYSIK